MARRGRKGGPGGRRPPGSGPGGAPTGGGGGAAGTGGGGPKGRGGAPGARKKRRPPAAGGFAGPRRPGAKGAGPRGKKGFVKKPDYFMQPGRRGVMVVLRRPIGNRATPKVCGVMPTRQHALLLIQQLVKAESVVKDLFLEATDDGIEALEAVLAACRDEVLKSGPPVTREISAEEHAEAERDQLTPRTLDPGVLGPNDGVTGE